MVAGLGPGRLTVGRAATRQDARRISRAIESLPQDQAGCSAGHRKGGVLTAGQGRADGATWADDMKVDVERHVFDMTKLAAHLRGLADGDRRDPATAHRR